MWEEAPLLHSSPQKLRWKKNITFQEARLLLKNQWLVTQRRLPQERPRHLPYQPLTTLPPHPRVYFKVVSEEVSRPGGDKEVTTYTCLDSGSNTTLCLSELTDELGLDSYPIDYTITKVNHDRKESGRRVQLTVEDLGGETSFPIDNVLTTESIPVGTRHFR